MTNRAISPRKLIRTSLILIIIALGVPLSLSQLGTTSGARFGASDQLGPNQLAAATLSVAPGVGTVALEVTAMTPGDVVWGQIELVNDGSLPLRYAMETSLADQSSASRRLAESLEIEIRQSPDCSGATPVSSTVLTPNTPVAAATRLFGDPAPGPDVGDRFLPVGGSDTLCYRVSLPIETENGVQSQSLAQTFIVEAEHVVPPGDTP